jgi:hypothetical protein
MQLISFKSTSLFKRGIWLSAAALLLFVAAPAALDGGMLRDPAPSLTAIAILGVFLIYFFWRTQTHRLADAVLDCQDHLEVHRGRIEETVALANVAAAEVSSGGGFRRITITLRKPGRLGRKIEFLPQASLWSNPSAIERVAADLTERANQAQRALARAVDQHEGNARH